MVWCGVCFPLCVSPSVGLELGSQFPLLDFRLLCRSKIKRLPRPMSEPPRSFSNTHSVGEWWGLKTNDLASPGYLSTFLLVVTKSETLHPVSMTHFRAGS